MRHGTVFCLAVAISLSSASAAFAQHHHHHDADADAGTAQTPPTPPTPPPDANDPAGLDQAARLLFESARTAFAAGDYPTALQRFQQAYSASPRPLLLYNIATTLDRLRRDDEAVTTFEQFLAAVPDTANRAEIEGRLRALHASIDERHAQDAAAQAERNAAQRAAADAAAREAAEQARREELAHQHEQAPAPASGGGGLPPAVFWATAITGGASLAAGAIFGGLTIGANNDYTSHSSSDIAGVKAALDNANSMQLLTNVFLFAGGGIAAVALVLAFVTDWGGHADTPSTTPTVSLDDHHFTLGAITRF